VSSRHASATRQFGVDGVQVTLPGIGERRPWDCARISDALNSVKASMPQLLRGALCGRDDPLAYANVVDGGMLHVKVLAGLL